MQLCVCYTSRVCLIPNFALLQVSHLRPNPCAAIGSTGIWNKRSVKAVLHGSKLVAGYIWQGNPESQLGFLIFVVETVCSEIRYHCSPPARWRVVRFYQSCSSASSSFSSSSSASSSSSLHPRPCLYQLPRPLPPCQLFANLFANFRAQWALLDLNCRFPIWVGTAGPQPQGSERSGHRWTSTSNLPSPVGTAGPQPGTFRAQWAPLDLNPGPSELSGHRWTSTAR